MGRARLPLGGARPPGAGFDSRALHYVNPFAGIWHTKRMIGDIAIVDGKWIILSPAQLDGLLNEARAHGIIIGRVPAVIGFVAGVVAGFLLGALLWVH